MKFLETYKQLNETNGLVTIKQVTKLVMDEYLEYLGETDELNNFSTDTIKAISDAKKQFSKVKNISELIRVLDQHGFSNNDAINFIFEAILK